MYNKILVPLDGSAYSEKALDHAVDLARKYSSKVVLLHVVARIIYAFAETYGDLAAVSSREMAEEGKKILAKAQEKLAAQNIPVESKLSHGNPAEEILKAYEENNIELVVIGSRGLGGIKAFFLGSVSSRVSRYAKCPVLIVK